MAAPRLQINEIFHSIQGESTHAGRPCTFVRLTGCPLRCVWCDTAYAFHEGGWMTLDAILERVAEYGCRLVEVTGGEPLAQPATPELLARLLEGGFEVLLETSGALPIDAVPAGVHRIVDWKAPDSGMSHRNLVPNLAALGPGDELKFVLASRRDYTWARDQVRRLRETGRLDPAVVVLFSPVWESDVRRDLAQWILEDALPVRYQVQLHKVIWPEVLRGV